MSEFYEDDLFGLIGPTHLTQVVWEDQENRTTVAACLVKGTYVQKKDHEEHRKGFDAAAPLWWTSFGFEKIEDLKDERDKSVFGAVFEYKPRGKLKRPIDRNTTPESIPPKYVIAFRGTTLEHSSVIRDLHLDLKVIVNRLTKSSRYKTALEAVQARVSEVGAEKVWLAGHSLGASLALQVGKFMVRQKCHIETYLFNPPYTSLPIEKLPILKGAVRFSSSLVTAGISNALKLVVSKAKEEYDKFAELNSWTPRLFVNKNDIISCEYIGYFEHRQRMESSFRGLALVERAAAQQSFVTLLFRACGKDHEPHHLLPSAFVVKNLDTSVEAVKLSHGLQQWWLPKPNFETNLYQFS